MLNFSSLFEMLVFGDKWLTANILCGTLRNPRIQRNSTIENLQVDDE